MPQTLAQRVRAKYPGAYDDLSDAQLEQSVRAKYPGVYDDLPSSGTAPPTGAPSALDLGVETIGGVISAVNTLPIMRQLYDEAAGEFTNAQRAAAGGDVLGTCKSTLMGSPLGSSLKFLGRMGQAQLE